MTMIRSKFDSLTDPNKADFEAGREAFFSPKFNPVGNRTGRALEAYNAGMDFSAAADAQGQDESAGYSE